MRQTSTFLKNDQAVFLKIIQQVIQAPKLKADTMPKILHKNPGKDSQIYSKSDIYWAYEQLKKQKKIRLPYAQENSLKKRLQMKQVRTISGVTPVTVLTKPFPCPGQCIFCPNDIRMPKSYLSSEPGAQRAANNRFDPYLQTYNRLVAFSNINHPTDKVELIILGGTWTAYPKSYQIWFIKRCFDAMNDFRGNHYQSVIAASIDMPYDEAELLNQHKNPTSSYNLRVSLALISKKNQAKQESTTWQELFSVQKQNETAQTRCVGLVIETRPDEITLQSAVDLRRMGATKIQFGVQSLSDQVLKLNHRGHNTQVTRRAFAILRQMGFKLHAHWMANLYGSNPQMDVKDYQKLFAKSDYRPDELKVYPCSLIQSAELVDYFHQGLWKPYTHEELLWTLKECLKATPAYCRITRMIRDFSSDDIMVGNKKTNFRQIVELALQKEGTPIQEMRWREIRGDKVSKSNLKLSIIRYKTSVSQELFLQYITNKNKIAGFLRLSLPTKSALVPELKKAAMIREVHVYGTSVKIGRSKQGNAQHIGLGKSLMQEAAKIAKRAGYKKLAVISAVGTREYYRKNGFIDKELYQHLAL